MSHCENDVFGAEDRCSCNDKCDARSACALKEILDDLDRLNNRDLRTLAELIDRILCCRPDK